ncbi:MAG TPA: penicillin-insensitive murein endopeptidase [Pyrinomonadaceae bacterium]|jgi:Putative peptidoglycan-binding domain-containing protein|nr:penicillin-insensitive murein endopeptidase [Pyrinomonadaceae bacterium]
MPENGVMDVTLINIPGIGKTSEAFKQKLIQIAADLKVNPNFLAAVMSFESGETFSPSIKNAAGSGAVGLIQFMPPTAKTLGTSTAALAAMSAEDQLDFVAKYFRQFKRPLLTIEDVYMAVLMPSAIGKGSDFALFKKPSKAYDQNKGLDINQDGVITVGEAADRVRKKLGAGGGVTGTVLRRGASGPEVERLQDELVDLGYMTRAQKLTGIGSFGPITENALKHFQADNQLVPNGSFDSASQASIRQINEGIGKESRGNVVEGLQDRLVAVGLMTVSQVNSGRGIFGPQTDGALKAFQLQHGIAPTGILKDETYKALLLATPTAIPKTLSSTTSVDTLLPESGIGFTTYNRESGGADQFGRAATIRHIQELGELWSVKHPSRPIAIGDISRKGGGPFLPHATHKDGLDVDMRPLTNNGINEPTNIGAANYSHEATRELIVLVRDNFDIEVVFFNDPLTISEGLSKHAKGHDNHVHVRFKS